VHQRTGTPACVVPRVSKWKKQKKHKDVDLAGRTTDHNHRFSLVARTPQAFWCCCDIAAAIP
jgi:hypothetical protein